MKRVVVGLSGGVDSSVAAYLLKKQGYEVIALFMKNWHDDTVILDDECPWIDDSNDALLVAQKLDIPFHTIDLSAAYKERIVDYMFAEYEAGRTPNPDVLCNREIKFDVFLKAAMDLKADFVATGHYCQKGMEIIDEKEHFQLIAGADSNKDQSYFLCQLNQDQLSKALFPIGHLQKPEVREIATELDLVTADKKDSQGLCFVGKIKLPQFLQQKLKAKEGDVVVLPNDAEYFSSHPSIKGNTVEEISTPFVFTPDMGKTVGKHTGAHFFTIGQRKGLGIGGFKLPLFVIGTDVQNNVVYVGEGDHHQGLNRNALFIQKDEIHWLDPIHALEIGEESSFLVRIRYRQPLVEAKLTRKKEGLYIHFSKAQKGITSGQFAAWYSNDLLIGSGVITH